MVYAAKNLQRDNLWELPGGFVVRTQRFHYHGLGSIPDLGTKILQTAQQGQKKKKKKDNPWGKIQAPLYGLGEFFSRAHSMTNRFFIRMQCISCFRSYFLFQKMISFWAPEYFWMIIFLYFFSNHISVLFIQTQKLWSFSFHFVFISLIQVEWKKTICSLDWFY